jgi:short-subunit dehydrogenase
MEKRAIITGATAGIGRALAVKLAQQGYRVGVTGRREPLLQELQKEFPDQIVPQVIDVAQIESCRSRFDELVRLLGGLDLCVVNAGIKRVNPELQFGPERETIAVNIEGFVAILQKAAGYFIRQGRGHLVGVSSVAAFRGYARAPGYNASKAYVLNYLEGIHANLSKKGVTVTDIRPGFVQTDMTRENQRMFWVSTPEKAAEQIYRAIVKKKRVAYITGRWRYVSWLFRALPNPIWRRLAESERGS